MIEVQLNQKTYSNGGDDIELSDVVTELLWVMNERNWHEVVVKLSPGFKVGTTHRQVVVNGCRQPVTSRDSTLLARLSVVQNLMVARGLSLFAVREVSDD